MKLLFIRHGETVDNVAQNYAGITDSLLTNHGVLQTIRLGEQLTSCKTGGAGLIFKHIFASDLQRASKTGQAIADAQLANGIPTPYIRQLFELQEVNFGSREGTSYRSTRPLGVPGGPARGPDWRSRESNASMAARADRFIDEYLLPAVMDVYYNNIDTKNLAIAVVSHGIFLGILWSRLKNQFWRGNISSMVVLPEQKMHWSNTGYIILDLMPGPPEQGFDGWRCVIEGVNVKTHLDGLERTGGGVGSSPADGKQRQISDWLSKQP